MQSLSPKVVTILFTAVGVVSAADIRIVDRLPSMNAHVAEAGDGFANEVTEALETVPVPLRQRIADAGWSIELVTMVVDAAPELRRKHPSGWPGQSVWENADAVHLPAQKRILIATHRRNSSGRRVRTHRVSFVVRHEVGHAIDRVLGTRGKCFSDSTAYQVAHQADCETMTSSDRKSMDYYARRMSRAARQESFAELFAMHYGGGTEGNLGDEIQRRFPRCHQLVEELLVEELLVLQ
jgi:hypothetical protein